MLQCTKAAANTLDLVREQQGLPDTFGIRLFPAETPQGEVGLGLAFTEVAAEGDEVTEQHGTRLIVAPEIAGPLTDMTLDVVPDPSTDGDAPPQLVLRGPVEEQG
jgi:Fe-S cluster assembly iron-binding protein IscA